MSLKPGDKLGLYSLTRVLGRGGMGEVWRARDERLDRDVAIKMLPAELTAKPELVARFEREAKLLATLNHHNIAGIYGLEEHEGTSFIIMECVEGESLATRLNRGRVLPSDALEIARQVAEGLDAAHGKGIIHRDLKPGNIQVGDTNEAKVLDFGLARAAAESRETDVSSDSWMTSFSRSDAEEGAPASSQDVSTSPGTLLGTVPYMSPEQARGQVVDRRTDIWSFGCVLYECLAGRRPFTGETQADVLSAILSAEPDWSLLHPETPPTIALLLRRCLAKDRRKRLQDIGDARVELEHAIADPSSTSLGLAAAALPIERPRWRTAAPWILAALLAVAWLGSTLLERGDGEVAESAAPPLPVTRFRLRSPQGTRKGFLAAQTAISPDGRTLIMSGNEKGGFNEFNLYRRSFDGLEFEPVPGITSGIQPSVSPDGKHLAFTGSRGLYRVALNGGSPEMLVRSQVFSPTWGDDGSIAFTVTIGRKPGIYRLGPEGGEPELLVATDAEAGEEALYAPHFLPGSRAIIFGVSYQDEAGKPTELHTLDLADRSRRRLLEASPGATWIPPGFLVYQRGERLLSQRMDPDTLTLSGDPILLVDGLTLDLFFGLSSFCLSRSGTLVYDSENVSPSVPTWITREGRRSLVSEDLESEIYQDLIPSPDGRHYAAITRHATDDTRLGIIDARRGTVRYVVRGSGFVWGPQWSPADPDHIIYGSGAGAVRMDIYRVAIDGRSDPEVLLSSENRTFPSSWSHDGKTVVFDSYGDGNCDIMLLHLEDPPRVEEFRATKHRELLGRLSPDQKWMAFCSADDGRSQVFVRAYPGPGKEFQVSISGGTAPTWSEDMERIFFRDVKSVNKVYEVSFAAGAEPELGRPRVIFDQETPSQRVGFLQPDGQRLLLMDPDENTESIEITVVLNLTEELKRRHAAQESR